MLGFDAANIVAPQGLPARAREMIAAAQMHTKTLLTWVNSSDKGTSSIEALRHSQPLMANMMRDSARCVCFVREVLAHAIMECRWQPRSQSAFPHVCVGEVRTSSIASCRMQLLHRARPGLQPRSRKICATQYKLKQAALGRFLIVCVFFVSDHRFSG